MAMDNKMKFKRKPFFFYIILFLAIQNEMSFSQESQKSIPQNVILKWYNEISSDATLTYSLQAISSTTVSFRGKTQNTVTEMRD